MTDPRRGNTDQEVTMEIKNVLIVGTGALGSQIGFQFFKEELGLTLEISVTE